MEQRHPPEALQHESEKAPVRKATMPCRWPGWLGVINAIRTAGQLQVLVEGAKDKCLLVDPLLVSRIHVTGRMGGTDRIKGTDGISSKDSSAAGVRRLADRRDVIAMEEGDRIERK